MGFHAGLRTVIAVQFADLHSQRFCRCWPAVHAEQIADRAQAGSAHRQRFFHRLAIAASATGACSVVIGSTGQQFTFRGLSQKYPTWIRNS